MQTTRALLRRPTLEDVRLVHGLESNLEIVKWTPMQTPRTVDQTRQRLQNQIQANLNEELYGFWLAETIEGRDFIGWFMVVELQPLSPSLGFMIMQDQWGKGLATEISRKLIVAVF